MKTKLTQELPDLVEHYCEICGDMTQQEITAFGDYEYYTCLKCGYQVSYRVR